VRRYGSKLPPDQFYWAVNRAYHAAEAPVYRRLHADHWEELEPVWNYLLRSALDKWPKSGLNERKIRILDVGAGTGLVGDFLSRLCPERVAELVCLDPSREMLDQTKLQARTWPFRTHLVQGLLSSIAGHGLFDVVTVNSVLHHVVEIDRFFCDVAARLKNGGLLLTAQDGVKSSARNAILAERKAETERRRSEQCDRSLSRRVLSGTPIGCLIRKLQPSLARNAAQAKIDMEGIFRLSHEVVNATNAALVRDGVIQRPMSAEDIWAVTDFHVPSPNGVGEGFDVSELSCLCDRLHLVSWRTYHYHGVHWFALTQKQRAKERILWETNDPNGMLFCSIWCKEASAG